MTQIFVTNRPDVYRGWAHVWPAGFLSQIFFSLELKHKHVPLRSDPQPDGRGGGEVSVKLKNLTCG